MAELWSAVNSDAMHGIAASLFGAWLHGKAALDRFSIKDRYQYRSVAWPPLHLMHAASGSGVVLCCFGPVVCWCKMSLRARIHLMSDWQPVCIARVVLIPLKRVSQEKPATPLYFCPAPRGAPPVT